MTASHALAGGTVPPYSVLSFLRPYTFRFGLVFGVMVISTFLGLLNPWFIQQLVDRVLLERRPDLLWIFAAAIGGVALFRFAMSVLQAYVYAGVTSRVLLDMRTDFLAHLHRLSLRFFAGTRFGDIVTRLNRDISALQEVSTGVLLGFFTSVLTLVGTVAWGLIYDWQLFLLAAIPFPLALVTARLFRTRVRVLTQSLRELATDLASIVIETIMGIRTVRSFGREQEELDKFTGKGEQLIEKILAFQLTSSFAGGLPRVFLVAASVIVYTVGGAAVIRGELPLGELIALGMYVGMVFGPLTSIAEYYLQLVQARVSLERVREIRELAPEVVEDPGAPPPGPVRGEVRFESVSFRYRPEAPLLEGVDFAIAAGEKVAVVGPSGSGKSTLVDLLFRFLDPASGRVLIDGQDLRAVRMRDIRARMAVVSQDSYLFNDTLFENIRYGSPGSTREEVLHAASLVGIDPMLAELPDGIDTVVGERGSQLSSGQRQRVSIARALLRKPAILVLDEATSALDYTSDRAIRAAIVGLMEPATTLIITHRLSSLLDVDRILVLEEGRIVAEGAPAELAERSPRFRRMLEGDGSPE